ncbi:MAG: bifunctional riboflavin kinase/FAD synthetase [Rickettsiales bacterium]
MHLIRHLPAIAECPSAVAIGNFDGLHLGHAAVIRAMRGVALAQGLVPSVLTFEPHPRRFFAKATPSFRLARLSEKLAGLRAMEVEQVAMPRFDAGFAAMKAEDFLNVVLAKQLGAKAVVTGENFAFGHQRQGDSAMLKRWGSLHGVEIITVPPVMVGDEICSSSAIRALVSAGKVAEATALLGHDYTLSGRVVHGEGRGKLLGFPTANIALTPDLLLPAHGVYAVRVAVNNEVFDGVANLGIRPTVAVDKYVSFEVYIFDTLQDFYGKKLTVTLVHNLRSEMKFNGVEALKAQIGKDCDAARNILRERA